MTDSVLFNHLRGINSGDPACLATHATLVEMMQNGDAAATRALLVMASLQKQLRYKRNAKTIQAQAIVAGWEASGAINPAGLVTKPIGWVAGVASAALNTAGNLLAGAGTVAAKPFHWSSTKLGNVHAKFGAPALMPAAVTAALPAAPIVKVTS